MTKTAEQLLAEAQAAPVKPGRSSLDEHRAVIFELRRKRWTFAEIAAWLTKHGVAATTSNVHRFYHVARRTPTPKESKPAKSEPPPPAPTTPPPTGEAKPKRKYRFNLDV